MNLIVVGCGRVGAELAFRLYQNGHDIAVVDYSPSAFQNLHPDFRGRLLEGDALNQDVLRRAGIEATDGLAAVTNLDSLNAAVCHLAREFFRVPNVVARNYDSRMLPLYESFGLQVVSSASWGAQRIEEMLYYRELRTVFSAGNGEVEVYEFTLPDAWEGRRLSDLLPENGCAPSAITRGGRALLPDENAVLKGGDIILVSATLAGIQALRRQLKLGQEV